MQLNSFSFNQGSLKNQSNPVEKDFSTFKSQEPYNVENYYHGTVEGGDDNPFNPENLYHHFIEGGDDNPFNPENLYHHRLG